MSCTSQLLSLATPIETVAGMTSAADIMLAAGAR
jgi:hypothetical protein